MVIRLSPFAGMLPRVSTKLLPQDKAQTARNAKLISGELRPFLDASVVQALNASTRVVFPDVPGATRTWVQFDSDADIVNSPIKTATGFQLFCFTTGGKILNSGSWSSTITRPMHGYVVSGDPNYVASFYYLGVPKPTTPIAFNADTGTLSPDPPDPAQTETRYYVYTFVTAWGEEGPPSDPSPAREWNPGAVINLKSMDTSPGANYNTGSGTKRIYRTNTGYAGTEYQLVAEIPMATTTYADSIADDQLGEVLPSSDWVAPPTDMVGITAMANGILAGFYGREIYFCEPYQPHAWPIAYRLIVEDVIVALGAYETNLVIVTEGQTWIASGVDSAAMALTKIPIDQSCTNKRGMANCGSHGVVYPSPDGLIAIGNKGIRNVTEQIMSRREWQDLGPENIIGFGHDEKYFGFYSSGDGFVIDLNAPDYVELHLLAPVTGGYSDLYEDALYLIWNGNLTKWEGDTDPLDFSWRSKVFELPYPVNFGCAQVYYEAGDGTELYLSVYADGVLKHRQCIASATPSNNPVGTAPFRLPSGFMSRQWDFLLEGDVNVQSASIAEVMSEIGRT